MEKLIKIMNVLFWNVRGLGGKNRRGKLKVLISKHRVDGLCIQETMEKDFTFNQLSRLVGGGGGQSFSWN
jgi:exonuclease III